jgi:LysR family transcriptional regulator, low CO2-responsive transcriptional regulator
MEMPSNETIKQAVMAGMGLSFLSLHTIGLERASALIQVVPVQGTPVVRTWNVVHLAGRTLSPAAEALRYFILEHAEALLAAEHGGVPPEVPAGPVTAGMPVGTSGAS